MIEVTTAGHTIQLGKPDPENPEDIIKVNIRPRPIKKRTAEQLEAMEDAYALRNEPAPTPGSAYTMNQA